MLAAGVVNVGLGLVLATGWPASGWPVVEIVVGLRMLTAGWSMVLGRAMQLGAAETPPDTYQLIESAERELVAV